MKKNVVVSRFGYLVSVLIVIVFANSANGQSVDTVEGPTASVDRLEKARSLTLKSMTFDATRFPFLGHFMDQAATGWNSLPSNLLRDRMQQELILSLTNKLKSGLSAYYLAHGVFGAPELSLRLGAGLGGVSVGTSVPLPFANAGYRDGVLRDAALHDPLMKPVQNPEATARAFRQLIETSPEAAKHLLPMVESLFTVSPLTNDPTVVMERDWRVALEEAHTATATELRHLREDISRLSKDNARQAQANEELAKALDRHQQLSAALTGELTEAFLGRLAATVRAMEAWHSTRETKGHFGIEERERAERQRQIEIARTYRALEDWVNGVATIGMIIDPKAGGIIGTAGTLILQATQLYFAPSFSSFGGMLSSYSSLVSTLFGEPDVAGVRHAELVAKLDAIGQKLDSLHRDTIVGFASVHEHLVAIDRRLGVVLDITADIADLQRDQAVLVGGSLRRIEMAIADIRDRSDRESHKRWLEARELANQSVSIHIFDGAKLTVVHDAQTIADRRRIAADALAAYIRHADQGSTMAVHVGEPTAGTSDHLMQQQSQIESVRLRGGTNSYALLARMLGINRSGIRNPEEYLRGVNAALTIPEQWPADYPRLSPDQKALLAAAGREVLSFQGELVTKERLAALINAYETAATEYLAMIATWVASAELRAELGMNAPIDLIAGADHFKSAYSANQARTNTIDVPLDVTALTKKGPQFGFPPKQVFWEHQNEQTPLVINDVDANSPFSWARIVGVDTNTRLPIDVNKLMVNTFVATAYALRGEKEPHRPAGKEAVGSAQLEAKLALTSSAYNKFEGKPIFKNTITVSITPVYELTITAGEPKVAILRLTATAAAKALKVYDKVYHRAFTPVPGTSRVLGPEDMADVTMNKELPQQLAQTWYGEVQPAVEASLAYVFSNLERIRVGGGADMARALGTLEYRGGASVEYSGTAGKSTVPLEGVAPTVPPGFTLTIVGSALTPEHNRLSAVYAAFLLDRQQAALVHCFQEGMRGTGEISKAIERLDVARIMLSETMMQGSPGVVLEEPALFACVFGDKALLGSGEINQRFALGVMKKTALPSAIESLRIDLERRVTRLREAVSSAQSALGEGRLFSRPGMPAIREALYLLERVESAGP